MILKGSLAVVSGGSRGIGLGIAQAFASKGASVVLLGRSSETLQAALGTLSTSQSQQHTVHEIDVSKAEAWHNLSKTTNCPDILVNAAGKAQMTSCNTKESLNTAFFQGHQYTRSIQW